MEETIRHNIEILSVTMYRCKFCGKLYGKKHNAIKCAFKHMSNTARRSIL